MHITSTGTMDKQASRIRQELAKQADLVGAIRLADAGDPGLVLPKARLTRNRSLDPQ